MKGKVRFYKTSEYTDDHMLHGENYAFFHRPDCMALAPQWYQRLIGSATRSVYVWDPYFNYKPGTNDNDCRLFGFLSRGLKVRYLMVDGGGSFNEKINNAEPVISSLIPARLKPNMDIMFGYITTDGIPGKWWEFHDRYLIIDEDRFFLVGSSVGYHLDSKASTGIYELQEGGDKKIVKDMFDTYWGYAHKLNNLRQIAL